MESGFPGYIILSEEEGPSESDSQLLTSSSIPSHMINAMHSQCRVSSLWKGMQGIALRFDGEGRCDFDRRVNTWGPWSTF